MTRPVFEFIIGDTRELSEVEDWCCDTLGTDGWSLSYTVDPVSFNGAYTVVLYSTMDPEIITFCRLMFNKLEKVN